jgi:Fanconi-associated nuclease 1
VWATLFGLLLWDVLFSPVEDVFRTPLQTAPLDLDSDAFYPARRAALDAALARVAAGGAPAMLAAAWGAHCGTLCRGVSWERWSLEELSAIAECVGGAGLGAVCRLLAQDHGGWRGGMPDLLLWRPAQGAVGGAVKHGAVPSRPGSGSASGTAKLVEVKGPRDRLSDQQRAWMAALAAAGVEAEVLKVVEPNKGKGRGKS